MEETPTHQNCTPPAEKSWTPGDAVIVGVFFVILAYYKQPVLFLEGRFFAEEGQFFFANLCDKGLGDAFTYFFRGRLELFTNLASWLAGHAPLQLAPRVTIFCALAAQLLPVMLIGYARRALGISLAGCLLFVFLMISLPQMLEVWLTTTSIHFHFAFMAALVVLLPAPRDWRRHLFRVLILACGLSGVSANFILPFFYLRAALEKDRERFIQAAILTATALLQIILLLQFSHEHRPQDEQTALAILISFITHQTLSPMMGIQAVARTSILLKKLLKEYYVGIPLAFAGLLTWGGAWVVMLKTRRPALFYILGLDMFLVLAYTYFSLTPMKDCLGATLCTRYFFLPNCLFLLALVMGLHLVLPKPRMGRFYLGGYLSMMLIAAFFSLFPFKIEGPSWNNSVVKAWEIRRTQPEGTIQVPIWPEPWIMDLPASCVEFIPEKPKTEN